MWQGQGHIPTGFGWSALWPQFGQRAANSAFAVAILQFSSFRCRGHVSQRVISLTPRGATSQRSQRRLQGEALHHQSVAPLFTSVHIDDTRSFLPISFALVSEHKGINARLTKYALWGFKKEGWCQVFGLVHLQRNSFHTHFANQRN